MAWSAGAYEEIAKTLLPAASTLVEHAGVRTGERVLDLGCGTGNVALLAAAKGARVTGVDPAERLLGVARAAATSQGLDVTFVQGEAGAIPLGAASVDLVLSCFAVIFAPDAHAAASEMARVCAPGGRVALTAWLPEGAIFEAMRARRAALEAAQSTSLATSAGSAPVAPPFAWYDRDAVATLLRPYGFDVAMHLHAIAFTAASPRAFVELEAKHHPGAIAARGVLEPRGGWAPLEASSVSIFTQANEDPAAFRVTSKYVVMLATRRP